MQATSASLVRSPQTPWLQALRTHWPEYLMEAGELGIFLLSACVVTAVLQHPGSPVRRQIDSDILRRFLTGLAMGATLLGIVYSPWGKRSGAHLNPVITLNYFLLGKIERWDAAFYVVAQFLGALAGVATASLIAGSALMHESVHFAATVPGTGGRALAFAAEVLISFGMMFTVLATSNSKRFSRYTPYLAAALVAAYITFEAPLSGMSMNPARTLGSAAWAGDWAALWIYFTGPFLGMFLAAQSYRRLRGAGNIFCAKLHHHNDKRCLFRCNYAALAKQL